MMVASGEDTVLEMTIGLERVLALAGMTRGDKGDKESSDLWGLGKFFGLR